MTMAPSFWADPGKTYAKRNNLFIVQVGFDTAKEVEISPEARRIFDKVSGNQYVAQSVNLPSLSQGSEKLENPIAGGTKIIQLENLNWEPVTVTFSDFVERGSRATEKVPLGRNGRRDFGVIEVESQSELLIPDYSLYQAVLHAWHEFADRSSKKYQGGEPPSTKKAISIFSNIVITSHFPNGDIIDKWTLRGIIPLKFENSALSYEDQGIRRFSLIVDYYTAEYSYSDRAGNTVELFKYSRPTEGKVKYGNRRSNGKKGTSSRSPSVRPVPLSAEEIKKLKGEQ